MPIDHYKMSIQAKPLYSVLGRADAGSLMKIVRPLGSIRRAKLSNCASNQGEILPKSLDISSEIDFLQQDIASSSPRVEDSESTVETSVETSADKEESVSVKDDQFLPKMQRTKNKVFESRYKIAASRNSESVKPARLYNKRTVYLPMFRINVETYVGNEEDTRAVENTRQSLKMMIDRGRRQTKNAARVKSASIKSYNFVTPGRESSVSILDSVSPRPLVHTERAVLSSSRRHHKAPAVSECQCSVDGKRQTSEGTSDDTDKMEVNFESLDLNSSADESIGDQMSVENRSEMSRVAPSETTIMTSKRGRKPRAYVSLTDPYRNARQSSKQQDQSKIGWPSYEDFRKMKQKIRYNNTAKKQHPLEEKQPANDVQKWVNIHYTRRKSRTSHSPSPGLPKLDPIIVPSHTCVDCPMCDMVARGDRSPTSCPPNSPAFDVSKSPHTPSPQQCHSDSKLLIKDNMVARTAQNRNEMAIPKVTVKILDTKQQLAEARLSYSKFPN